MFINLHQWECDSLQILPASGNWYLKASSSCFLLNNWCFCFLLLLPISLSIKQVTAEGGQEKLTMKVSRISSLWRMQFLTLGKRIVSTRSAVTLGSVRSRASLGCCRGSYLILRQIRKLKSQCKQVLGQQRSYARFSYDIHSYSLNFDNGFDDHLSPHSFRWWFVLGSQRPLEGQGFPSRCVDIFQVSSSLYSHVT